jgi:Uma2 family endonuclease
VTPEEFLNLPDSIAYELVDGRLLERNVGTESSEIAAIIIGLLQMFMRSNRLGRVFTSETSYRCFSDAPTKLRRADVSFIRFDRLPNRRAPKGYCPVAPDLAVEVISPNDTAEEVDKKVLEWLGAGVGLVWVASPGTQSVRIHRPRGSDLGLVSLLMADDMITGEDVLPGFSSLVRNMFPQD